MPKISGRATYEPTRRTHRAPADVALLELPELVAVRAGLEHLAQRYVHEIVAVHKMAVERLAVFKLN